MMYPWLNPGAGDESEAADILPVIDRKEWSAGKKNLYAVYYMDQKVRCDEDGKVCKLDAGNMRSWRRQSAFKKTMERIIEQEMEKFRIAGMLATVCETLVLFFAKAVWDGEYLINFSVDALVGVAALVITLSQLKVKYRQIKMYTKPRDYYLMDGLSLLVCILCKIAFPPKFDLSLFVLLMNYFLQRKRFYEALELFEKEN